MRKNYGPFRPLAMQDRRKLEVDPSVANALWAGIHDKPARSNTSNARDTTRTHIIRDGKITCELGWAKLENRMAT